MKISQFNLKKKKLALLLFSNTYTYSDKIFLQFLKFDCKFIIKIHFTE